MHPEFPMSGSHSHTATVDSAHSSSSFSTSTEEEESENGSYVDEGGARWLGRPDELDPSDSASYQEYHQHRASSTREPHSPSRRHRLSARHTFAPPMSGSVEQKDYMYNYGGVAPMPPGNGAYYGAHRAQHSGGSFTHAGGFGSPSHYNGQVVPYGYPQNPFTPMAHGPASAYQAGYGEIMPYHPQGGAPYYSGPVQHAGTYGLPHHMTHYLYNASPPPPPTEAPAPAKTPVPAEPPKPDPVLEALQAKLSLFEKERKEKEEAEQLKILEEKIRKDAEEAFNRRMEEARKAQEVTRIEVEKAKAEAERAARDRLEAERKAEEERRQREDERKKQHEEDVKRAQEDARQKLKAELVAAEEQKKAEAAAAEQARKIAEEAARLKIEAALKAEAEAKAAAEKKAAEEQEKWAKIEADAKLKAEIEAREKAEAARKAAEEASAAEEQKKKEDAATKAKIEEETKAKIEEENKKAAEAEKAPIKFKDAVGRKFSFPYRICRTWQGMEELIKQAFLHIGGCGPRVQDGQYDLIGPNGEIILPSIWEKVVEPDWSITMLLWPDEKPEEKPAEKPADKRQQFFMGPNGPVPVPDGLRPGHGMGVGHHGHHGHRPSMSGGQRPAGIIRPPGGYPSQTGGLPPPQVPPPVPRWNGPIHGVPLRPRVEPEVIDVGPTHKPRPRTIGFFSYLGGVPPKKRR